MRVICTVIIMSICVLAYAQVNVSVDETVTHQTIEGFGGFGPKKVWWESGPYFDQEYLNQTIDNLGATIFRTQIYWDGEETNDNDDPNVINADGFDFGASSDNGKQFPFIEELNNRGAKIIATVWTPPVWMKLLDDEDRIPDQCYNCNNCPEGDPGRQVCGGRLNPIYYEEFAEYLVAYVKAVKAGTGVDIFAISIQNEPYFANPFEANVMYADEYADVLKVVGERFEAEELTTRFFGPEHMAEWSWGVQKNYVNEILNDAEVAPHLDIYAVHGYVDGVAADYGNAEGWTELHNNITVAHGKSMWMTETSNSEESGYTLAFNMARALYLALKFGNISGWVYWYMAEAMIDDNKLTPLGFAFKNFYRYVRPGAVRVNAESNDADVLTLAFNHPESGDLTVLLINQSEQEKTINLSTNVAAEELSAFRTSASENCISLGKLSASTFSLPGKSIVTLSSAETPVVGFKKKEELKIKVYPNPSAERIEVSCYGGQKPCHISISNSLGMPVMKTVLQPKEKTLQVETSGWKKGLYIIEVTEGDDSETRKIVIQ